MTYDEIVAKVADELSLPKILVDRTYKAYWKAVRDHMTNLPLKEDLTDEEFLKLQPNVNVPSLGKFYITLERYRWIKDNYNKRIQNKEEDVAHI